jgi:hemerythrin
MIIEWTPALSIGVDELDREHKAFFALINHLGAAMSRGCGTAELSALATLLQAHADRHFAHEEAEMELYAYPGLAAHRAEHGEVVDMLDELADRTSTGSPGLALAYSQLLSEWLLDHVATTDMKFGTWLNQQRTAV